MSFLPFRAHRALIAGTVLVVLTAVTGCASTVPGIAHPAPDSGATPSLVSAGTSTSAPSPAAPAGAAPLAPSVGGAPVPENQRQDPQIVDHGFSSFRLQYSPGWITTYAVVVRNPNPNTWVASSTRMTVTFRDVTGHVVLTDDVAIVYGLGPGQTSAVADTDSGGKAPAQATSMDVQISKVNWFTTSDLAPGDVTMGNAVVRPSPDADSVTPSALIDCAARSTYRSKVSNFFAMIVYRDGSGKIIGGTAQNSDANNQFFVLPGSGVFSLRMKALFTPPTGIPAAVCYPSYNKPL